VFASCTDVLLVKVSDCLDNKEGRCSDKEIDYRKVPGIPFYVKTEQFKQTTVYAKTYLKSTLTVELGVAVPKIGKEVSSEALKQSFEKQLRKQDSQLLSPIKLAIINARSDSVVDALAVIKQFEDLPAIYDDTTTPTEPLKNTVEAEWIVDVNQQYYLNAPLPWFGSGNLTQELHEDGTLAKATSTPDTKLAEGISSLIPFKEYLTGRLVKEGKDMKVGDVIKVVTPADMAKIKEISPDFQIGRDKDELQIVYVLSLSIDEVGHEYTFTRVHKSRPEPPTPIPFNTLGETFSRLAIGNSTRSDEKTSDGSTVGITGSIKFPKDWGADTPAEPKSP